ncbi:MAG TPA: tetratricopeptide repeat protein [Candidatus Aquilonibacter sp.]|nr:tetratricopeptide repeat protein [Candidatus Aquilonibacter sp.]
MQKLQPSLLASALLAALFAAGISTAQNLPAGTREADAPSPQDAVNAQIRAAESALESGNYPAAIAALKPLAAAQPKNAHILYDLGFALEHDPAHSGNDAEAAAAYRAAFAADPTLAQAELSLGLLDARDGHIEAAHHELAVTSNLPGATPDIRARALRSLAVLDEQTNPSAAQDELLAALKLTPETPADILLGARLAEHAQDFPDAEAAYRRLLAITPNNPDAIAGLAHSLAAQHTAAKTAEAETLLTNALKTTPGDPRLLSQLAAIYSAEGKADQAIPLIEQLRASSAAEASDPAISRLLAHLYTLNGDYAKAEPLLRALVAADPTDPTLLDDLASSLVEQQKFPEAQALLTKAVAMRSSFPSDADWAEAEGHLAFAASRNHDPNVTLQALNQRATVLPNSPASLFLEATAYDTLHQNKDAKRAYRAFLALAAGKYPDQEWQARHRLIALERER